MGQTRRAMVTGITGQDGYYLTKLLLQKGYEVHGLLRWSAQSSSLAPVDAIRHFQSEQGIAPESLVTHDGDLTDAMTLTQCVRNIQPDEIYNLGAISDVKTSFAMPEYTANVDALGALRLLESVRLLGWGDRVRIYQASTSELYGLVQSVPQNEQTPFYPRSPYAVAKQYAYWMTVNYREAYGMHASNGILFNHESPLRGKHFVTRKITLGLSRVLCGLQHHLELGNLNALRDWGHAKDYVKAMYAILQQERPDDYVIATGVSTSVRDFCCLAAASVGITMAFEGEGLEEVGYFSAVDDAQCASQLSESTVQAVRQMIQCRRPIVRVNPDYFRPTEVASLVGDASLSKRKLSWEPTTPLQTLVEEMMRSDLALAQQENLVVKVPQAVAVMA